MLTIHGSQGEGGGQILRTSLALSMITGTPFRLERIRARRARPGLRRQHLTAVDAAAKVCGAAVEGAAVGSSEIVFRPGSVRPGKYDFDIGTAGSTTLVLQTVLPALLTASGPSEISLTGGTHNPLAPPFEFLAQAFLPLVNRMGPRVQVALLRSGFYPAGGGKITAQVVPAARLAPFELGARGRVLARRARARVAKLPRAIAERELRVLRALQPDEVGVEEVHDAMSPGNVVLFEIESEALTEVVSGIGERGVPAETVAGRVVEEVREYLGADAPVGKHLADQLLLLLALAGGGSFRTLAPTPHTTTNLEVIRRFIDTSLAISPRGDVWEARG